MSRHYSIVLAITLLLLTLAPAAADALALSPSGAGNVLILPYYTVNGGFSTQLQVSGNSTLTVLRVRVHESRNGREVSVFNVFVPPHATWTATIFNPGGNLPAGLLPDQNQCTAPNVLAVGTALPDGRRYIPFNTNDFSGSRADGGGDSVQRTREGWIEIFATAQVKMDTAADSAYGNFLATNGAPHCDVAVAALGATGNGLLEATPGTLVARAQIVDPQAGTLQGYTATAITGFGMSSLYDAFATGPPTLADAQPDAASHRVVATITERVREGDASSRWRVRDVSFPPERAVDAVSAVLAHSCVQQDFVATVQAGAATDWVLTFPTKRYYTDPALVGVAAPRPPFYETFAVHEGRADSCAFIEPNLFSRSGEAYPSCEFIGQCIVGVPPPTPRQIMPKACFGSSVIAFSKDTASHVLKGAAPDGLSLTGSPDQAIPPTEGTARITLLGEIGTGADAVEGLPVVGFAATGFVNGNVTPGVLSNYTSAAPLRDCSTNASQSAR